MGNYYLICDACGQKTMVELAYVGIKRGESRDFPHTMMCECGHEQQWTVKGLEWER